MQKYKTVYSTTAQAEIVIEKSRFITSVSYISNEEQANGFIKSVKSNHHQANHNVFAYVINQQVQRYSDDGEPSGTAGKPVLEVINRKQLLHCAVVITRYFGGIMLGAGGLVRAYTEAAIKGIEKAGIVEKVLHQEYYISIDYPLLGLVKKEIEKAGGQNIELIFDQRVRIKVDLLPGVAVDLMNKLNDYAGGRLETETGCSKFI